MRRMSPVDLANYIITMLREEIAAEAEQALVRKYRSLLAAKRPFTEDELADAWQELDEESAEWVAYCTRCGGAIEASCDHRLVLTAALTHVHRRPGHQVIVGTEILGRSYAVGAEP